MVDIALLLGIALVLYLLARLYAAANSLSGMSGMFILTLFLFAPPFGWIIIAGVILYLKFMPTQYDGKG